MVMWSVLYVFCLIHYAEGQCSGTVLTIDANLDSAQRVESTNYPQLYPSYSSCTWWLDSGGSDRNVYVWIATYNIEAYYDYLKIYDGSSTSDTLLGHVDGSGSNLMYRSTGRYLFLKFYSDYSVQKTGFWLQHFSLYSSGNANLNSLTCTPQSSMLDFSVASTGTYQQTLATFPGKFSGSDYCYWRLDAGLGKTVNVTVLFTDFYQTQSNCNNDGLQIYEGTSSGSSTLLRSICNATETQASPVIVHTSGQYAYFVFRRQSIGTYRGFVISYKSSSSSGNVGSTTTISSINSHNACGTISLTAVSGNENYITSPYYPYEYLSNRHCTWSISTDSPQNILIEVYFLDLEDPYDKIKIYDGQTTNDDVIVTLTGVLTGINYTTTGSHAYLVFTTDSSVQKTGFSLSYKAVNETVKDCFTQLTAVKEIVAVNSTPAYIYSHTDYGNSTYSINEEIYWLFRKEDDNDTLVIIVEKLELEHSPTCQYDYLKLYDGPCETNTVLAALCGTYSTEQKYEHSRSRFLLAHFRSDFSVTRDGFKIKYYTQATQDPSKSTADEVKDKWWLFSFLGIVILLGVVIACCIKCCRSRRLQTKENILATQTTKEMKRYFVLTKTDNHKLKEKTTTKLKQKESKIEKWKRYGDNKVAPVKETEPPIPPSKTKDQIDSEDLLRNVLFIPTPFVETSNRDFPASKPAAFHRLDNKTKKGPKDSHKNDHKENKSGIHNKGTTNMEGSNLTLNSDTSDIRTEAKKLEQLNQTATSQLLYLNDQTNSVPGETAHNGIPPPFVYIDPWQLQK